ncbi:MAG: polysaccharide deacetylase family protein [Gammaproteobacteria bacterium]|nr:polysaccharide deacetylase family protein [Gammaproteobacteria bacterium]
MQTGWRALREELQRWQDAGLAATFWWRDDDAEDDTAQLGRLLRLAAALDVAPALAVIPAGATPALAQRLHNTPQVDVLQHGYAHLNHAPAAEKKAELGAHRAVQAVAGELTLGRQRLITLVPACLPVLVPPWNRIDQRLLARLSEHGYRGISTFSARAAVLDAQGLTRVNTHVDPIAWRGGRGFCGDTVALRQVLEHLSERRLGRADRTEPTGLLTHHLVQDDDCWAFCDRLITETRAFDSVTWELARALFSAN